MQRGHSPPRVSGAGSNLCAKRCGGGADYRRRPSTLAGAPLCQLFFRATSGIDWSSIGDWPVMDGKHGSQSQLTIAPHELIQSDFWLSIDWALIFDWAFIGVIPTGFWGKEVSWRVILNSSWQTLLTQLCSRNFEQIWLKQNGQNGCSGKWNIRIKLVQRVGRVEYR